MRPAGVFRAPMCSPHSLPPRRPVDDPFRLSAAVPLLFPPWQGGAAPSSWIIGPRFHVDIPLGRAVPPCWSDLVLLLTRAGSRLAQSIRGVGDEHGIGVSSW